MKVFVPLISVLFLTACATAPVDTEAAHQEQLEKEARENFYALRSQMGTHPVPPPTPVPKEGLFASTGSPPQDSATQPAVAPQPPRPTRKPKPTPRNPNDTVYYWQVAPPPALANTRQFTRAEIRYARALAKSPEDLTPEERLYAREHF